jgi:DNA-binding PadR family transcriptional regulator
MDKKLVLEIFAKRSLPLTPDDLRKICLENYARTSVYTYLLRLKQQELVERSDLGRRIAYRITARGMERLQYLKGKSE